MLIIDGSQGEGGGQVLRTSLSLAAITGRAFRLVNIRANRRQPGLRPQHLTGVRAVATLCQANVTGAALHSTTLEFWPGPRPGGGSYTFDVGDATAGGSAGAVTLVLQAILWPLLLARGPSQVTLRGGTHVPFSPPYHYVAQVARPAFARLGADFDVTLNAWGWYPAGGGEMQVTTRPVPHFQAAIFAPTRPETVPGVAAVTNLPAHIPNRMAHRAANLLRQMGLRPTITPQRERGRGAGAGIFLWLPQAGFSALGRKGLPADQVADAAVAELAAFIDNRVPGRGAETPGPHPPAAVDAHLADQLLLPMALAQGTSQLTTNHLTQHTLTNAALLRQWLDVTIQIDGRLDEPGRVTVHGVGFGH